MALAQLSLKLPPEVLADWRRRAAAAGHGASVRDWLLAELSGPADAPGAALGVAERLAALEAAAAELRGAVALLQAQPAPSPPPAPEALGDRLEVAPPIAGSVSLPDRRLTLSEAAGLLSTPEVGAALGLASDSALTNWIRREASKRGGSAVGAVYRGHRLRGKGLLPGGQKPGWLWERVGA